VPPLTIADVKVAVQEAMKAFFEEHTEYCEARRLAIGGDGHAPLGERMVLLEVAAKAKPRPADAEKPFTWKRFAAYIIGGLSVGGGLFGGIVKAAIILKGGTP
jgi:hypothetical protein